MSALYINIGTDHSFELLNHFSSIYGVDVMGHVFEILHVESLPITAQIHHLFEKAISEEGTHIPYEKLQKLETMLECTENYLNKIADCDPFKESVNFSRFWTHLKGVLPKEIAEEMLQVGPTNEERRAFLESKHPQLQTMLRLNLCGAKLTQIPKEISLFDHIIELDLSDNFLKNLNDGPPLPQSLRRLKLNNNKLDAIPEQIYTLKNLRTLELTNNNIKEIGNEIQNLSQLNTLRIDQNDLTTFPQEIAGLTQLIVLSATFNSITTLPENIGDLKALRFFYLFHNQLDFLPDSFCDLENLQVASLGKNYLHTLPDGLQKLSKLKALILSSNLLREFNNCFKESQKLHTVMLDDNLLEFIDKEMFNLEKLKYFLCTSLTDVCTDQEMMKFFLPSIISSLTPEECTKLSITYRALGNEKWREFIDGEHHCFGEDVFESPRYSFDGTLLHKGEPGYKASMYHALQFLDGQWKRPLSAEFYLEIHKRACSHFAGEANATLIGQEGVGVFRKNGDGIQATFASLDFATKLEFQRADVELKMLFGPTFGLGTFKEETALPGSWTLHYLTMTSDQIQQIFNLYLTRYHHEMASAVSTQDKIRAIGKLIRYLEWLHPPKDGCGRTDTALLNFLLTACGLHPVLLSEPYRSSYVSMDQWVEILEEGLSLWEAQVAIIKETLEMET